MSKLCYYLILPESGILNFALLLCACLTNNCYLSKTLGDSEKRAQYDNFGTTSGQAQQRNVHPSDFFGQGFDGFSFRFGGGRPSSNVHKLRITLGYGILRNELLTLTFGTVIVVKCR